MNVLIFPNTTIFRNDIQVDSCSMEIFATMKGNKKCDIGHYNILSLGCNSAFVSAPSARRGERSRLCKLNKPVMEFC